MLVSVSINAFLIVCLLVDIPLKNSFPSLFIYINTDLTASCVIQCVYSLLLSFTVINLMLNCPGYGQGEPFQIDSCVHIICSH